MAGAMLLVWSVVCGRSVLFFMVIRGLFLCGLVSSRFEMELPLLLPCQCSAVFDYCLLCSLR